MRGISTSHYILIALGISILLHLMLVGYSRRFGFFGIVSRSPATGRPFLQRFEIVRSPVVENPNAAHQERPPENARMPSDRNAVAKNRAPRDLPKSALPFSKGDLDDVVDLNRNLNIRGNRGVPPGKNRTAESWKEGQRGEVMVVPNRGLKRAGPDGKLDFGSYLKRGGEDVLAKQVYGAGIRRIPMFQNLQGAVLDDGALSLNTYEWDFAPYMIRLKKRIQDHIYPPAAFSLYGMIDGKNVIRFQIGRNGRLLGVEVMGYEGSKLLIETSAKAVELSDPFQPLPSNFPEAYLEVTGHFHYFLIRNPN